MMNEADTVVGLRVPPRGCSVAPWAMTATRLAHGQVMGISQTTP